MSKTLLFFIVKLGHGAGMNTLECPTPPDITPKGVPGTVHIRIVHKPVDHFKHSQIMMPVEK